MKFPHVLIVVTNVIHTFASIKEICDVEGSGLEDCPVETYCCKPSECQKAAHSIDIIDIEYDFEPRGSSNKRCCDSFERYPNPKPDDCKICTECCDERQRKQNLITDHCSKCRRCNYSTDIEAGESNL